MNKIKSLEKIMMLTGNSQYWHPKPYSNFVVHYDATPNIDYITYYQGGTAQFRHDFTYNAANNIETGALTVY